MTKNSEKATLRDKKADSFRHDLRTHLSAILSLSELIKKSSDPQETSHLLDALHLAADNALAMVDRGEKVPKPDAAGRTSLVALLTEFSALAKGLAKAKGSVFNLSIDGSMKAEAVDAPEPVYLHRILMLLLDNALKYAQGADIVLQLGAGNDGEIQLTFSDTGPGFGDEDPNLLFEAYHRGSGTKDISGTGLGLWSVRGLVDFLQGTIRAEDNIPSGARFVIELPSTKSKASKIEMKDNLIDKSSLTRKSILVVDDNQTNHLILGEMLKAMAFDTIHVASAAEALTCLETAEPDLALIDIRMKPLDGWQLAQSIEERQPDLVMPLIAMSSDAAPEVIAPFRAWLQRPVNPDALYAAIKGNNDWIKPPDQQYSS